MVSVCLVFFSVNSVGKEMEEVGGAKNPIDKSYFFLTLIIIMCIGNLVKIFVDRLILDFCCKRFV